MLYLNNELLNMKGVINAFQALKPLPPKSDRPSGLTQLKRKLMDNYFEHLKKDGKKLTEAEVFTALKTERRFQAYPSLRTVLHRILSLDDTQLFPEDAKSPLDTIVSELQTLPVDWYAPDKTQRALHRVNATYEFFKLDPTQDRAYFLLFQQLSQACQIQNVLFEEGTLNEAIAYDYAYKLMALFLDPTVPVIPEHFNLISKETYQLLTQVDIAQHRSFHDTLIVNLELPHGRFLDDMKGWRKLIKTAGLKAFPFFRMAEKIEAKLGELAQDKIKRAPQNLEEAKKIATLCFYTRATEDEDFAVLCNRYRVSEARFNRCLDYIGEQWPKKQGDTIPHIDIKGEGAADGYYWVKLPPHDKRALILGDITDCCQSIAGHSEECVKDAVSLDSNGLYILLKERKKGAKPFNLDRSINDTEFDIVGQSYIWRSKAGNLCLDSIECLRNSIPDLALKKIIGDFAAKVLQNNPDIIYVTLGQGGKTPRDLFKKAVMPEKMLRGRLYGDAISQYCIAVTPFRELDEQQMARLDAFLATKEAKFAMVIRYLCPYFTNETFVEDVESIIREYPKIEEELTHRIDMLFLFSQNRPVINDLIPVPFDLLKPDSWTLEEKSVLKQMSLGRLLWRGYSSRTLANIFPYLSKAFQSRVLYLKDKNQQTILHGAADNPGSLALIMESYSEEERFKEMKEKDIHGRTVWHLSAKNPDSLVIILNHHPKKEVLQTALKERDSGNCTFLYYAIHNPASLTLLLDLYSDSEIIDAFKQEQHWGMIDAAFSNPASLTILLKRYPYPQLIDVFNKHGTTVLHYAASEADAFAIILKYYPELQRIPALEVEDNFKNTVLHAAARNPKVLGMALGYYEKTKRLDALKKRDANHHTVLYYAAENLESLSLVLSHYSVSQQLDAIKEKDALGQTVLHKVTSPEALEMLLSYYPESERVAAMNEKDIEGRTPFYYAWKKTFEAALENPTALNTLLVHYPHPQLIQMLKIKSWIGLTLLHSAAYSYPEAFLLLLDYFPQNERFNALTEITDGGRTVWDMNLKNLPVIVNRLPDEYLLLFLKEVDQKAKSGEMIVDAGTMTEILKRMPEVHLLAWLQEKNKNNTTNFGALVNLEHLTMVINRLSQTTILNTLEASMVLAELAENPESFAFILQHYPHPLLLNAMENSLMMIFVQPLSIERHKKSIELMLDYYPTGELLTGLRKNKELLGFIARDHVRMSLLLSKLSPQELDAIRQEPASGEASDLLFDQFKRENPYKYEGIMEKYYPQTATVANLGIFQTPGSEPDERKNAMSPKKN